MNGRGMRAWAALAIGLVPRLLTGTGCTVGGGSGNAAGPLWVLGCNPAFGGEGNYGTPAMPQNFSLDPIFFAGVPIEDLSMTMPQNRLVIRMQRNGGPLEINNTLWFDIQNSFEVARCVRGRVDASGVGDWNVPTNPRDAWCDWTGTGFGDGGAADGGNAADGGSAADGGARAQLGRIRVTSAGFVQASLTLLATCPVKDGAALVGHSVDGWIEFLDFGAAAQPNLAPDMRTAFDSDGDFKVNFGERLRANFHVVLEDDRVITARRMGLPEPTSRFGAVLDGRFDFDLVRGRAAQPFP